MKAKRMRRAWGSDDDDDDEGGRGAGTEQTEPLPGVMRRFSGVEAICRGRREEAARELILITRLGRSAIPVTTASVNVNPSALLLFCNSTAMNGAHWRPVCRCCRCR